MEPNKQEILNKINYEIEYKGYTKATYTVMIHYITKYLDYLTKPINQTNQQDIKDFIIQYTTGKPTTKGTKNHIIASLNFLYTKVLNMPQNKMPYLHDDKHLPQALTVDEVTQLIRNAPTIMFKLIFTLLYACGLRIGECVSIQTSDIDMVNHNIRLTKTKGSKHRIVHIPNNAFELLERWLKKRKSIENQYVFNSRQSHITTTYCDKVIKQTGQLAGIKQQVHCHLLRSSFATHVIQQGLMNIRELQDYLGHESLETTQVYLKVNPERINKTISPFDKIKI